jgi:hypothetical protein
MRSSQTAVKLVQHGPGPDPLLDLALPQSGTSPTPLWSFRSQSDSSPGPVQSQSGSSPAPVRSQSGPSPVPVRSLSGPSSVPVRSQFGPSSVPVRSDSPVRILSSSILSPSPCKAIPKPVSILDPLLKLVTVMESNLWSNLPFTRC